MKLTGIATGYLTDTVTGKTRKAFEESNHIQDDHLQKYIIDYTTGPVGYQIGNNIFVSSANPGKQRRDYKTIGGNKSTDRAGTNIDGVTSPEYTWFDPVGLHLKEIKQRFAPPVVDKTIYTIGVTTSSDATMTGTNGALAHSLVNLAVPCIQLSTETLDVFYRIQAVYDPNYYDDPLLSENSTAISPSELFAMCQYVFGVTSYTYTNDGSDFNASFSTKINPRRVKRHFLDCLTVSNQDATIPATVENSVQSVENYRRGIHYSVPITANPGKLVGTVFHGTNRSGTIEYGDILGAHQILSDKNLSPLQSTFGHSSAAVGPFYDSGTVQTGLGTLQFNADSWTDPDWPKMLILDITTTGGVGVGEYRFRYRNQLGFDGNSWDNHVATLDGFNSHNYHFTDGFRVHRGDIDYRSDDDQNLWISAMVKYKTTELAMAWIDELCIADIHTQEGIRYASGTTVELLATDIGQYFVDSSDRVWMGCRSTGVHMLNAAKDTITVFDSSTTGLTGITGCYGLAMGVSGRLWGYFNHATTPGLYYSDNDGTSWTRPDFSHAAIDADPTMVTHIHADPTHADGHIAVLYGVVGGVVPLMEITVAWWDFAATVAIAGAAVDGPQVFSAMNFGPATYSTYQYSTGHWVEFTYPISFQNVLNISPNSSFWAINAHVLTRNPTIVRPKKLTFGSATLGDYAVDIGSHNPHHSGWGIDENGDDALIYITSAGQGDTVNTGAYDTMLIMLRPDLTHSSELFNNKHSDYNFTGWRGQMYFGEGMFISAKPAGISTTDNSTGNIFAVCAVPNSLVSSDFDKEAFPTYGWNGSAWVKDNAGSRPIHSTTEDLIDGVTVNFDDASGTNTFNINDTYNVGLYAGIQMDSATTFDYEVDYYYKPGSVDTAVEASTLPAVTRVPNYLGAFEPTIIGDYQDNIGILVSAGKVQKSGTTLATVQSGGARSAAAAIASASSNLSAISRYSAAGHVNVQGYVEFSFDNWYNAEVQSTFGISSASVLGTAIDPSAIEFAINFSTIGGDDFQHGELTVLESGIVKATLSDYYAGYTGDVNDKCRILLLSDGTVVYEAFMLAKGWVELYRTPIATAPIVDYYFDCAVGGTNNYFTDNIKYYQHTGTDYYLYLGDGVDTGCFDPEFVSVDSKYLTVMIDGVEAVNIGDYDTDAVLGANSYSCFGSAGVIRYSASDIGKSVSAVYTTISHE